MQAFISAGSNIDPQENLLKALLLLAGKVDIKTISTVYETRALGRPEQQDYYNCVLRVDTNLPPRKLKYGVLRMVEEALGRVRTPDKYAPRTMDLDLIVYDDLALRTTEMALPDPQITQRPFLAISLFELAPELILPGTGQKIKDVAAKFRGEDMVPLTEYTELLRREVLNYGRREG